MIFYSAATMSQLSDSKSAFLNLHESHILVRILLRICLWTSYSKLSVSFLVE